MTRKQIIDKRIMLDGMHEQLEDDRKKFISVIRGHPEFYKPALAFAKKIEDVLSWYQMELMATSVDLIKEIESGKQLIMIMELYGIYPSQALSRWNEDKLEFEHKEALKSNCYKVPEKLRPYIDWEKIAKEAEEKSMEEFIAQFPHLKDEITRIFRPNREP